MKLVVDSINKETGEITFTQHGVSAKLVDAARTDIEGRKVTFYGGEHLQEALGNRGNGNRLRMPDPAGKGMEARGVDLKNSIEQYDFKDAKDWVNNLLSTVDFASMKKQGPEGKGEKIKYLGKAITNEK